MLLRVADLPSWLGVDLPDGDTIAPTVQGDFLEKLMERELSDGLYVPEEVFALQDALPVGEFANYRLEIVETLVTGEPPGLRKSSVRSSESA